MNKIKEMVDADLNFELESAHEKLLQCASLRAKYSDILLRRQAKLDELELNRQSLWGTKWRYYSMDYNQEVDRRDIPAYIEGDPDYIEHMTKQKKIEAQVKYVDNVLKAIDGLNWSIPAAIKWYMFKHGS